MHNCTNCGAFYEGYACPNCGMLAGIGQQTQTVTCPGCGAEILSSYRHCIHCGAEIQAGHQCQSCGGEVLSSHNHCIHCGAALERPEVQAEPEDSDAPETQDYQPEPNYAPPPPAYQDPFYAPVPQAPPKSNPRKAMMAIAVAVVVVIAAIAAAVVFMEVSNPFNDAVEIFDGDTVQGEMLASDTDNLYKIQLGPGDVLVAALAGPTGTDFDLYAYENIQFLDRFIITGSAGENSSESMRFVAWEDDYYIIDVYSYAGSGNYSLSVSIVERLGEDGLNDGDNTRGEAQDLVSGSTVSGEANEYYDEHDYYKLELQESQVLYARLTVPVQTGLDFDLYICDLDGDELAASEAAYGNEEARAYAQAGGYYYVEVRAFDGIGNYTLYVEIQEGTETDSNNAISSAEATFIGDYITGTVNEYDDADDYFSISLAAGETLAVTLTGPSDADFDLYLYNSNSRRVARSEDPGSNEAISYTAPYTGTHYINVYAYSGFGLYYLSVGSSPATGLTANAGNDRTVSVDRTVLFSGANSLGTITNYSWDFGDGATAAGMTANHTYSATGVYNVTLTVSFGADSDTDTATVTVLEAGSMPGKYALVVGISDYQGDGDLNFCDEDAASWTSYLEAQGYTVRTLIDDQAPSTAILDGIEWLEAQEQAGDYVAFVFSGHGSYSDRTRSSYICAWNIEEQAGLISDTQLAQVFAGFDSQHIFFFFDSCYSGGMDSIAGSGRYVSQTAGQFEYGLDDPKSQHGLWTYWFLEYAINAQGNSDMVRAHDVAYPLAVADAASSGNSMHPEEEFGGTTFFL